MQPPRRRRAAPHPSSSCSDSSSPPARLVRIDAGLAGAHAQHWLPQPRLASITAVGVACQRGRAAQRRCSRRGGHAGVLISPICRPIINKAGPWEREAAPMPGRPPPPSSRLPGGHVVADTRAKLPPYLRAICWQLLVTAWKHWPTLPPVGIRSLQRFSTVLTPCSAGAQGRSAGCRSAGGIACPAALASWLRHSMQQLSGLPGPRFCTAGPRLRRTAGGYRQQGGSTSSRGSWAPGRSRGLQAQQEGSRHEGQEASCTHV